jgi:hypothetical protein
MDKKKKILVISRKYPPSIGGMQAYSRSLVKNLSGIYDVFRREYQRLQFLSARGEG